MKGTKGGSQTPHTAAPHGPLHQGRPTPTPTPRPSSPTAGTLNAEGPFCECGTRKAPAPPRTAPGTRAPTSVAMALRAPRAVLRWVGPRGGTGAGGGAGPSRTEPGRTERAAPALSAVLLSRAAEAEAGPAATCAQPPGPGDGRPLLPAPSPGGAGPIGGGCGGVAGKWLPGGAAAWKTRG